MSNPYLSFLASLGGPTGSHSTLKKLASSAVAASTTTSTSRTSTVSTSAAARSTTAAPHSAGGSRTSVNSTSRSYSSSTHSSSSSSYTSSSSRSRLPSKSRTTPSFAGSNGKHFLSSLPNRNHDRVDSKKYVNGHGHPYSNDNRIANKRQVNGGYSNNGSSRKDSDSDSRYNNAVNRRKRERDSDNNYLESYGDRPGENAGGGIRYTSKDDSYSDFRARKRHASSRSRSRSRNRSQSKSRSRSRGRTRDRSRDSNRDRNRSRSRSRSRHRKNRSKSRGRGRGRSPGRIQIENRSKSFELKEEGFRPLTPPPPPQPSSLPRTPSPPSRTTYPEIDDTSSFSTLSSPASYSLSPSPRSLPSSPKPELTPVVKRRMESILQAEASYSSPSSLSSLSPDHSNHASMDRESIGSDPESSPYLATPTDTTDIMQATMDTTTGLPNDLQRSLEMELFGVASADKQRRTDDDAELNGAKNKFKKQGNGIMKHTTQATTPRTAAIGDDDDDDDEYASLGTFPIKSDISTKNNTASKKRHLNKSAKKLREIVIINTRKGTVVSATVPISHTPKLNEGNGYQPTDPMLSSKGIKGSTEDSQKTVSTTSNGLGSRRMSILHSDQIVAASIGRYKNHFHMVVEDSDSTVASSPSSVGADTMRVALEYPGKDARERFTLMKPFVSRSKTESDDKDEYNPIEDLVSTVRIIMEHFFDQEKSRELFGTASEGLYRNLTKFKNRKDGAHFLKTVEEFNHIMKNEKTSGTVQKYVRHYGHKLPYELVVHILQQVYSRTVASRASKLNQYEAFSNNVYGEILPILTKEFIQRTKLDHTKVFVDLGCGIGNVVLQVALQTGAESYGVEIMDTPAKFSKKQAKEFEARSRAYGLHHGAVSMIHGDFLDTPGLPAILARADVVLVNNYAFNSALNQSLLQLFLDLKEGCKIISLKTFVSLDHKINVRNAGSVESILRVKKYPYYTNAVSWTHNGGEYFIATVDRSAVQAFYANGGVTLDDRGRSSSRRR